MADLGVPPTQRCVVFAKESCQNQTDRGAKHKFACGYPRHGVRNACCEGMQQWPICIRQACLPLHCVFSEIERGFPRSALGMHGSPGPHKLLTRAQESQNPHEELQPGADRMFTCTASSAPYLHASMRGVRSLMSTASTSRPSMTCKCRSSSTWLKAAACKFSTRTAGGRVSAAAPYCDIRNVSHKRAEGCRRDPVHVAAI